MSTELALFGGSKIISDELKAEMAEAARWPKISESTVQKCSDMLRHGIISVPSGGIIGELEMAFKDYIGTKHCLLQNNGTSTLHAAFFAVDVSPGDEVIVPSLTWTATVSPIYALGATPVFCDVDKDTLNADPDDIERKITGRTKAICIVHLWGNVCDMDRIMEISRKYRIPVIEDCSHAHGAVHKGQKVGSIGAVGCFSMQGSKSLPGGELGAIVTDSDEYLDRIAILGHQGRIPTTAITDKYKSYEAGLGFKYRPFPLAAQIALDQLANLEEVNRHRKLTVDLYNAALGKFEAIRTIKQLEGTINVCYIYVFLYDDRKTGVSTERFIAALNAEGVPANPMRYKLVHTIPPFDRQTVELPVSEKAHGQMIMLTPYTLTDEARIKYFTKKCAEAIGKVLTFGKALH